MTNISKFWANISLGYEQTKLSYGQIIFYVNWANNSFSNGQITQEAVMRGQCYIWSAYNSVVCCLVLKLWYIWTN